MQWRPQFDAMQRLSASQSTADAVASVKGTVTTVIQAYDDAVSKINGNPRLSVAAKQADIGNTALDAQVGLQPADLLVNVIAMEVEASDAQPLPPPKSSGDPVVDEMRAAEIRAACRNFDAGVLQSMYAAAMMSGDSQFCNAIEAANPSAFPAMVITPTAKQKAIAAMLVAGASAEAAEQRDLRVLLAQLTAVVNDAKRFIGVDVIAQQAAGLGPAGGGFVGGNGASQSRASA